MASLTLSDFLLRTTAPRSVVEDVETLEPGWVETRIAAHEGWIHSRLAKRYAVPFAAPVPELVLKWIVSLVTRDVWLRRGRDPLDEGSQAYEADAAEAKQEVLEAANSEGGLFDLPLRQNTSQSGIAFGGTRAYVEASPYVAFDQQRDQGREEDFSRGGSYV